mmetsp:Transcript_3605/g.4808  ORF Transcript_3605/g.4808 Transcript_3605/m.4808 type:complete len:1429 (+) Transcript_3605:67-4353(+)
MDWTSVHTPTVVVLSSSEVELLSEKNGLAFHEMLSAFSNCQIKTHFRSISSHYPLNQLKVRFVRGSELRPRPIAVTEELMKISIIPKKDEEYNTRSAYEAQNVKWYERYRSILQESLLCGEESMTECPSLMMVAISTSDIDPISCFEQLDSSHFLPMSFQSGQYDAGINRYYLLVHDVNSPNAKNVDPDTLCRQMRNKFRNIHCNVLYINSLKEPNLSAPDVWKDSIASVFFPQDAAAISVSSSQNNESGIPKIVRGCYLSVEDMLAIKDLVHQIVIKEVVPAMEKRISTLNVTVTSNRKGVKNVIKSWWRKPREAEDSNSKSSSGFVQYRYDQIENQILTLADASFVMKDYETALSMFKLVKDDFKADKAYLHQGLCYIKIAICNILLDRGDNSESSLRDAYYLFQGAQQGLPGARRKEVTIATRLATHTAFLLADLLSNMNRNKEAAEVLVRASRDESYLSSAVLLEQAAWFYKLHSLDRKFSFHIILSGMKFHSCHIEQHAVRCLTCAQYIYEGTSWLHIKDYLQAHLAKHLPSEGHINQALVNYLNIVGVGRQSAERQAKYIKDFIEIFEANPGSLLQGEEDGCEIKVPNILSQTLQVYDCQNAGVEFYNKEDLMTSEKEMWHSLQCHLEGEYTIHVKNHSNTSGDDGSGNSRLSNLMDECSSKSVEVNENILRSKEREQINYHVIKSIHVVNQYKSSKYDGRVVGEAIVIGFSIQNPLDIPISLEAMQLVASLTGKEEDNGKEGEGESSSRSKCVLAHEFDDEVNSSFLNETVEGSSAIILDNRDIHLDPRQRVEINLRICPLKSGKLTISGLRWKLNGKIWSLFSFALQGQLLQDSLEHRAQGERSENTLLSFDILNHLPWISFEMDDELQETILQGEVVKYNCSIRNVGRVATSEMLLKSNVPWVYIGKEPKMSADFDHQGESPSSNLIGCSGTLMKLDQVLESGDKMVLPIWIRGVGGGKQVIKLLLQYTSQDGKVVRYIRQSFEVCVLPSLHMFASVSPYSALSPSEYILSVVLTNFRTNESNEEDYHGTDLVIHETCCLSKAWSCERLLSPPSSTTELNNQKNTQTNILKAKGSIVHYFKLTYCPPTSINNDSVIVALDNTPSTTSQPDSSEKKLNIHSCVAYMCLDDMADKFTRLHEEKRLIRQAQGNDSAPRSVSSVRRERAAGDHNSSSSDDNSIDPHSTHYHPASLKTFCHHYPSDISIVVSWGGHGSNGKSGGGNGSGGGGSASFDLLDDLSMKSCTIQGCHYLSGLSVCPKVKMIKEKQNNTTIAVGCPLSLEINVDSLITHNFSNDNNNDIEDDDGDDEDSSTEALPCVVPISIRITNQQFIGSLPLDFIFEIAEESSDLWSDGSISWLGINQYTIKSLEASETYELTLHVCFPCPGVYELNQFGIRMLNNKSHFFTFPIQTLVTVLNTNN